MSKTKDLRRVNLLNPRLGNWSFFNDSRLSYYDFANLTKNILYAAFTNPSIRLQSQVNLNISGYVFNSADHANGERVITAPINYISYSKPVKTVSKDTRINGHLTITSISGEKYLLFPHQMDQELDDLVYQIACNPPSAETVAQIVSNITESHE